MRTTMFNELILPGVTGDCQQFENRPANALFHPSIPIMWNRTIQISIFFFISFVSTNIYSNVLIFVSDLQGASMIFRERKDSCDNRSQGNQILATAKSFPRVRRASWCTNTLASSLLIAACSVLNSVRASDGVQQRSSFRTPARRGQLAWNFIGGERE